MVVVWPFPRKVGVDAGLLRLRGDRDAEGGKVEFSQILQKFGFGALCVGLPTMPGLFISPERDGKVCTWRDESMRPF